jgi:hypothetical protein
LLENWNSIKETGNYHIRKAEKQEKIAIIG